MISNLRIALASSAHATSVKELTREGRSMPRYLRAEWNIHRGGSAHPVHGRPLPGGGSRHDEGSLREEAVPLLGAEPGECRRRW